MVTSRRAVTPEQQDRQRARILDAAGELLRTCGYDRTRLRDVAELAGVSVGTLQHYFGTRDELMNQIVVTKLTRELQGWVEVGKQEAVERSHEPWERVQRLLGYAVRQRDFTARAMVTVELAVAVLRHPDLPEPVRTIYDGWRAPLRAAIEDGVDQGAFTLTTDLEIIVNAVMFLIDGCFMEAAVGVSDVTAEASLAALTATAGALLGVPT